MSHQEIATRLVQMCNEGKLEEDARELYAKNIVSIEGGPRTEVPTANGCSAALEHVVQATA